MAAIQASPLRSVETDRRTNPTYGPEPRDRLSDVVQQHRGALVARRVTQSSIESMKYTHAVAPVDVSHLAPHAEFTIRQYAAHEIDITRAKSAIDEAQPRSANKVQRPPHDVDLALGCAPA